MPWPTSSSTVNAIRGRARAGCPGGRQVGGGGHDLGHAGLVVGAEQRRPVGGDDVVADALGEQRARRGREHLGGVAGEHQLAAVVVAPDAGVDAGARRVRARVDVREEPDRRARLRRRRRQRRQDVAVLGRARRRSRPSAAQLGLEQPRQVELLRGARVGVRLPRRLRVDADVAEEALEHVVAQLGGERRPVRGGG